jgi:hypothetical protein
MHYLTERLTFDQLFRHSEKKRITRSATVRGPPLDIDANSDAIYHTFNFKSFPSTTGLRHRGYVRFFRPQRKNPNGVPLQHIPCEVDCSCPDFRYRWAWVLKQHQSSRVGPQSLNKAFNQAPKKTNPAKIPGLCKHILACRNYIYNLLSKFPEGEPDTAEKLDQMVKWATTRANNFPELSANAKDREKWYKAAKDARRRGQPVPPGPPPRYQPKSGPPTEIEPEDSTPLPPKLPAAPAKKGGPMLPKAGKPKMAPASSFATTPPPGARGRTLPVNPGPPVSGSQKLAQRASAAGFETPAEYQAKRTIGDSLGTLPTSCVSSLDVGNHDHNDLKSMDKSLTEARKLIAEMEQDELDQPTPNAGAPPVDAAPPMDDMPPGGGDDLPPSEPPVSDDAIGADTEGNVFLQILSDIRDFLAVIAGVDGAGEEGPEGPEGPGGPPLPDEGEDEDKSAVDAIPEPPEDEDEDEEAQGGTAPRPPE